LERKRSTTTTEPKPRPTKKCPDSFATNQELLQWAAENAPLVNVDAETAAFKDHTFKNAISEWPGAWRNWMRRANEFAASRRPVNGTHRPPAVSRHAGFDAKDYRQGITEDGHLT
jgi:hypothetical protein